MNRIKKWILRIALAAPMFGWTTLADAALIFDTEGFESPIAGIPGTTGFAGLNLTNWTTLHTVGTGGGVMTEDYTSSNIVSLPSAVGNQHGYLHTKPSSGAPTNYHTRTLVGAGDLADYSSISLTIDIGNADAITDTGDATATISVGFFSPVSGSFAAVNSFLMSTVPNGGQILDVTSTLVIASLTDPELVGEIEIRLQVASSTSDRALGALFDNLRITSTPIPEPSTGLSVAIGLTAMSRLGRSDRGRSPV